MYLNTAAGCEGLHRLISKWFDMVYRNALLVHEARCTSKCYKCCRSRLHTQGRAARSPGFTIVYSTCLADLLLAISEFSAGTGLLQHLLIIMSLPVMAHNTLMRPCSGSISALSSTTLRRVQLRTCPSQPKTNGATIRSLASVSSIPVDGIDNLVPLPGQSALRFGYEAHYASTLGQMKREKSYRYFRNVNRLAKQFPLAHSPEGKTVSVWCTNDYVRLFLAST